MGIIINELYLISVGIGEDSIMVKFDILCFRCKNYIEYKDKEYKNGRCIGYCSVVKNIGEFNNSVYYGNIFIPCCGFKYEQKN